MNSNQDVWWQSLPTTSFGSSGMEEQLAGLILAGRKQATVWNGLDENPTEAGMRWVVTVADRPVAVIETLEVGQCRFSDIDADFAWTEGEGDRSLAFWRITHQKFFEQEGKFSPDMLLWWERFKLVETIDYDLAAKAADIVMREEQEAHLLLAGRTHPPG